ncbi:unnamed protein product [Peronospora belbahrii]|uniref:MARVEL domain-containing protein n=1 Tax=Peronospora belbahrii TaxID=622444 RepID=A0ABN8CRP7_9STRA|nr:unnamed protein product [Peronospora belbahrii]
MNIGATFPKNTVYLRLGLRGVQLICSVLALAFAASGFYGGGASHSSTFVLLMGYTASDYTRHCGFGWHCRNLRAATAFDFIAMFFFLVSLALTFLTANKPFNGPTDVQVEDPVPYHQSVTPTAGALSPDGNPYGGSASRV